MKKCYILLMVVYFPLLLAAQNVTLTDNGTNVVLDNGLIKVTIQKANAQLTSYLYKGFQLTTGSMYYSMDGGTNYRQPASCVYSIKTNTTNLVDVSFKSTWTAQLRPQAFDIDVHYVMEKGKSGIYTYAILNHPATYPATTLGEWRTVWKLDQDQVEYICVDSLRHFEMPTKEDYSKASSTDIAEVTKLNTGKWAGKYECKYMYNKEYFEVGAYGHASDKNKIGQFVLFGGYDFFNDGPTKQDLSSGSNIIHVHYGMNHYGGSGTSVEAGEKWSKIFGPILFLANSNSGGAKACWNDALAQAKVEKQNWPYSWLTNVPEYPAKNLRGTATGKLTINDPYKPNVKGQQMLVGLTDTASDWQNNSKGYQYWIRTGADGSFSIPNIRPGVYDLHAVSDNVVEEFTKEKIVIKAGQTTPLGNLTWVIPRNAGELIWEIGVPNRSAKEFFHGNDYFKPFLWEQFSSELPNPINYTIGKSNWAKDWNYAHCAYRKDSVNSEWFWNVNFDLPNAPKEDLTFTVAFASTYYLRLNMYINGTRFTRLSPSNSGGNALIREGIHAKYSYLKVTIPYSKLRKGGNTISFSEFTVKDFFSHAMYDYISLEGFVATPPSPKVQDIRYCQNELASVLTAIGTDLKWYSSAVSTTALSSAPKPSTSIEGTTSYFVTQTLHGIESEKAEIKVTVNPLPILTHNTRTDTKSWSQSASFTACIGENVYTGPWPNVSKGWSWKGPNGFVSSIRNPVLNNIASNNAGIYTATYIDMNGCKNSLNLNLSIPVLAISIASPANNATLTTDIFPINTTVTGTNISNVSFYNGTNLLGTDVSSPYSLTTPSLANGTYTFSAIAKNTSNCTDTVKVTVKVNKVVTGTEEEVFMDNIQCFPNPFQDKLNLVANGRFDYAITDLLGNELESGVGFGNTSVGHSLAAGVYLIRIRTNESEESIKVNKQK